MGPLEALLIALVSLTVLWGSYLEFQASLSSRTREAGEARGAPDV
ncbi:MAG TPA: hypothetical protein VFE42_26140 [Chloroflexota bacterium]|nr:hypothetical protein [Chloroflexota bacterium]